MHEQIELNEDEREWLIAIDQEPMTKAAADERVPPRIRDSLIDKELICWKAGFLDVVLLETTSRGEAQTQRLRAAVG